MTDCDVDLLIAGAGPTGLMAAAEALRQGLTVRIVDRKARRSTFSKALVMHARTLEALEPLGLASRIVAAGEQFRALNGKFLGRPAVRVDLGGLPWGDTRYPYWLSIPQFETERFLEERVGELGGAVAWNTSLHELEQDDDGVTATLRREDGGAETCRARWLLGADGGRSRTRELVGIAMQRESLNQTFVLADAKNTCELTPDEGHAWRAKQGLVLIVPMPEPNVSRIIAHVPGVGPDDRLALDEAFFDDLIRERTGIEFGAHELDWATQFVLSQGLSDRYRSGRVFLAGDAAHVHSPVGGQGMNTGIQDAQNLVWKLARAKRTGAAAEPWLASYEQERRPVAHAMVQTTGLATKVLTNTNPVVRTLLAAVASRATKLAWVQTNFGRPIGMLNLGYERSDVLATTAVRGVALKPGQRLPNPELGDRRLHDLLDDVGHARIELGTAVTVTTDAEAEVLGDADGAAVREALGAGGDAVVLVRPDRCIAGIWRTVEELEAFEAALG